MQENLSANLLSFTTQNHWNTCLGDTAFIRTEDDESPVPSLKEHLLTVIQGKMYQDESNSSDVSPAVCNT